MMRPVRHICMIAATLLLGLAVYGCGGELTDEDRVRAVIEDMADAAGAKDAGRLKDHISRSYSDPAGNDYNALKGLIAFHFLRSENINVFLRKTDVEVRGDTAYATVRAVISRGRKVESVSDILPASTGGFIFDFTFTRDGSDWLLSSAIWNQVGVAEAL